MPDQPVSTVISSGCLKTRDKAIQEKHQNELAALERKVNKLKWANRDALNQLFDANNRGHNLAVSLGFNDVYHALSIVSSRPRTSYIASIERGKVLEEEVFNRTAESDRLREELDNMREERDFLKSQLDAKADEKMLNHSPGTHDDDVASPSKANAHRLCLELATLRARYDALLDVRQRSVARYKRDYKKWNAFKEWLFRDDASDRKSKLEGGEKSPGGEKERNITNVLRKRKMFLSMGLNITPIKEDIVDDSNKENNSSLTPQDDNKRPLTAMAPLPVAPDVTGSVPLVTHSLNKPNHSSPCTPPTPSVSGVFSEKQKEHSSPHSTLRRRLGYSGKTAKHETLPGSSDNEDESQVAYATHLESVPAPAPMILHPSAPALPKHTLPEIDRCHEPPNTATPDTERPKKIRRVSPHADNALTDSSTSRAMSTPADNTPREKGKGKEKQDDTFRTPAAPNTSKFLGDYSAYKGRGRYAKDITSTDQTINALYAIDPKQNGGLDFQFDEVVRNKDDRKKLNAGDCECCRDYYEAVGPLPKRLQQPLWRSPPNSPVKNKPCQQHQHTEFDTSHQQAISDHKQAISRHRHRWARASTPPDYWTIGFPSTQETANINKRAKEMHEAKRDGVEGEIERGKGKYKRR